MTKFSIGQKLDITVERICELLAEYESETGLEHEDYMMAVRLAMRRFISGAYKGKDEDKG